MTYKGKDHTITAAGINPLLVQQPIPLWIGGQSKPVLRRTGRLADGWFPTHPYFSEDQIREDLGATRYWVTAPWADLGPDETSQRLPEKRDLYAGIETRLRALEDFKKALPDDF